jgi:hypothetical protein
MSNCKNCGNQITWGDSYVKGDKPKNVDGSTHYCQKSKENFAENFSKPKVTPTEILGEIAVFYELYKDVDAAKFESIAKIYISRSMSR